MTAEQEHWLFNSNFFTVDSKNSSTFTMRVNVFLNIRLTLFKRRSYQISTIYETKDLCLHKNDRKNL